MDPLRAVDEYITISQLDAAIEEENGGGKYLINSFVIIRWEFPSHALLLIIKVHYYWELIPGSLGVTYFSGNLIIDP